MAEERSFMNRLRRSEDGMTLVEMMVSIVIIVTVLLASAFALNAAFSAQTAGEVKSRAVQLANEESEQVRQRNYSETRVVKPTDVQTGEVAVPTTYKGETMVTHSIVREDVNEDLNEHGLQYRKTRDINGTTFTIETNITRVTAATFDGAGANIQLAPATVNGKSVVAPIVKRVTIIVTWDIGDGQNKTAVTWVRSPNPSECIPPRVEATGAAGNTKWDAQERIQACETRR